MIASMSGQQTGVTPWEPPTEMVMHFGAAAHRFDIRKGERNVENYLRSCVAEMREAVLAMGMRSLHDVGPGQLCALDPVIAEIAGVDLAWSLSVSLEPSRS